MKLLGLQLNLDGSNIFGTIENCSRHGWLIVVPGQEANSNNLGICFQFSTQ